MSSYIRQLCALFFFTGGSPLLLALELEPRQWSHLPLDTSFAGAAYVYAEADIGFDPVLKLENVEMELHTWAAKFIHSFEWLDHSARVDVTQAYQKADWKGLVDGAPGAVSREGASDTFVRFAVNLYGAPPLKGKAYMSYKADKNNNTVIGIGLATRLPTGDYLDDKLLNLGGNRTVFRPQLGVSHYRGSWTTEMTSEIAFYTENDEFFGGNRLKQEPLYIVHGHVIYTFRPGLWLSASAGYDYGGETEINGVSKDDKKKNTGWGLKAAIPIDKKTGINIAYVNTQTKQSTGIDFETLVISVSTMW